MEQTQFKSFSIKPARCMTIIIESVLNDKPLETKLEYREWFDNLECDEACEHKQYVTLDNQRGPIKTIRLIDNAIGHRHTNSVIDAFTQHDHPHYHMTFDRNKK